MNLKDTEKCCKAPPQKNGNYKIADTVFMVVRLLIGKGSYISLNTVGE